MLILVLRSNWGTSVYSVVNEYCKVLQSPLEEELALKHAVWHDEKPLSWSENVVMSQTFDLNSKHQFISKECEICVVLKCVVLLSAASQAAVWLNEGLPSSSVPSVCLPLFLSVLEDAFTSRVLQTLLKDVKFGETVSYKRLAEMAGNPRAVRAVGGAMRRNPVPLLIPCHRVISSSGQSGPYMSGKGNHLKQWLLTHERQRSEG